MDVDCLRNLLLGKSGHGGRQHRYTVADLIPRHVFEAKSISKQPANTPRLEQIMGRCANTNYGARINCQRHTSLLCIDSDNKTKNIELTKLTTVDIANDETRCDLVHSVTECAMYHRPSHTYFIIHQFVPEM
ncbi:hypothetical protein F2P81_007096 [Scophthalmus maximus]|uniref:Uncharacterized protein n=1 Tax=Scophthalmus maximus TaxID=52904 RepID=A0A6A4T9Y1_SCOMX|nr:hypothetical protein F2P81_007096 [Scophthalmus maximus]